MAVGLSILVCLLSVGMLAGRIYEILYLTDSSTGFLVTKGIALNPVLTAIFAVIVICCAVILFGKELSVDILADICDTINYEIVCGISPRVPRIIIGK